MGSYPISVDIGLVLLVFRLPFFGLAQIQHRLVQYHVILHGYPSNDTYMYVLCTMGMEPGLSAQGVGMEPGLSAQGVGMEPGLSAQGYTVRIFKNMFLLATESEKRFSFLFLYLPKITAGRSSPTPFIADTIYISSFKRFSFLFLYLPKITAGLT